MTFLLDTNVVSELRKSASRMHLGVRRWSQETKTHLLHLSALTVMELEVGIRRLRRRDEAQAAILDGWLTDHVLPTFEGRILSVDLAVARRASILQAEAPRPVVDSLIAATAAVHGLTVVTRNVSDFEPLGVAVLDPWG